MELEEIKVYVHKRAIEIGAKFYQTYGLPHEYFIEEWNKLNLLQQLQTIYAYDKNN